MLFPEPLRPTRNVISPARKEKLDGFSASLPHGGGYRKGNIPEFELAGAHSRLVTIPRSWTACRSSAGGRRRGFRRIARPPFAFH